MSGGALRVSAGWYTEHTFDIVKKPRCLETRGIIFT